MSQDSIQVLVEKYKSATTEREKQELKTQIIEAYSPNLDYLVNRYLKSSNDADYDDAYQEGSKALLEALERYDLDHKKKATFKTFAFDPVVNAIKDFSLESGDGVLSASIRKKWQAQKIKKAIDSFKLAHGYEPTVAELQAQTDLSEKEIQHGLHLLRNQGISIGEPEHFNPDWIKDESTDPARIVRKEERRKKIRNAVESLGAQYQQVIELRYVFEYKQTEVAERMDISQQRVSQLEKEARSKLKELFKENGVMNVR